MRTAEEKGKKRKGRREGGKRENGKGRGGGQGKRRRRGQVGKKSKVDGE